MPSKSFCALSAFVALSLPVVAAAQELAPMGDCIAELRRELPLHPEVSTPTFDAETAAAGDLRQLIGAATSSQPEFELPIWDYLSRRVDAQRVAEGAALMTREAATLATLATRQGVDGATAVAVFGIETDYGRVRGRYPVVDATLSRACLNLKSAERKQQLFAALRLLQDGIVQRADFMGSWAGAFGMTQFMPGTYVRYMRDGPAEPPADIVHSVPDALATTARFLRGLGWVEDQPWGIEVSVPPGLADANALESDHACLASGQPAGKCRSVEQWAAAGVSPVSVNGMLPASPSPSASEPTAPSMSTAATIPSTVTTRFAPGLSKVRAALLMPAGIKGPAWLVTSNYQAIWRYNRADAYALAIGLLSDALRGAPPQRAAWPTDDPGLSRAEFVELQALLLAHGHCDLRVDGADGPRTRAAIAEEESRLGRPPTGRPGARLLGQLRLDAAVAGACSTPDAAASAPGS
jgi:membrane-bound lytic murein transglycosylase B